MNRFLPWALAVAVSIGAAPAVRAQAPTSAELKEQAAQNEAARQELENLERETGRAVQLHNGTFFRRVYSDDFIGTLTGGEALDKARFISTIEQPGVEYMSFVVNEIRVRLYQDTAVVTCLWSWRTATKAGTTGRQARVLHVYVNSQRGWQAVASQETVLPG